MNVFGLLHSNDLEVVILGFNNIPLDVKHNCSSDFGFNKHHVVGLHLLLIFGDPPFPRDF